MGTNFVEEPANSIFSIRDKVAGSSEMSVSIYQAAKRPIPDGSNLHSHCHENLTPHNTSRVSPPLHRDLAMSALLPRLIKASYKRYLHSDA
jgi:hypothetical protein